MLRGISVMSRIRTSTAESMSRSAYVNAKAAGAMTGAYNSASGTVSDGAAADLSGTIVMGASACGSDAAGTGDRYLKE